MCKREFKVSFNFSKFGGFSYRGFSLGDIMCNSIIFIEILLKCRINNVTMSDDLNGEVYLSITNYANGGPSMHLINYGCRPNHPPPVHHPHIIYIPKLYSTIILEGNFIFLFF